MSGSALLGRAREFEQLNSCIEGVRAGKGSLWLLRGEPGIGKSRLVEELASAAAQAGVGVAWGRAWEAGGAPPYWPFIQVLRELLQDADLDALLAPLPRARLRPLLSLLPELAERASAGDEPQRLEPAQARFALLDAVAALLQRIARAQPRLIVLEDLHAADPATVELLEFVSGQLRAVPLALVGTYRDVDVARSAAGAALQRVAGRAHTLALAPLARDEVAEQLAQTIGAPPSPALVAAVYAATEGNPLFVVETGRLLKAHGSELPGIEHARSSRPFVVPSSVRAVIRERLAALAPRTRAVLELGAVVGREFARATLARLSGEASAELAVPLADAVDAAVLLETAPGTYRFSHILLREVLHQDLPRERREQLHLQLAENLRDVPGGDGVSRAELAHHYVEAGAAGRAQAAGAALAAAEQAEAQFAFAESARFLQLALDAVEAPDDGHEAIALRLRLGRALILAGELAQGQARCREAADRARRANLPALLAEAALAYGSVFVAARVDPGLVALLQEALDRLNQPGAAAPAGLRARVMGRLAAALQPASDPAVPIALAREAIALARTAGDDAILLDVIRAGCSALMDLGDPSERLALNREHMALAERLGDRVEALRGQVRAVFDHYQLGDVAEARAAVDRCERIAVDLGHPHYAWRIACMQAMRAAFAGDFTQVERELDRAAVLGDRAGDPNVGRTLLLQRLGLLRQQGRIAELGARAADALRAVAGDRLSEIYIQVIRRSGEVRVGGAARADDRAFVEHLLQMGDQAGFEHMAELAAALGDRALIERLIAHMQALMGRFGHGGMLGMTWDGPFARGLGLLFWATERFDAAERAFASALERVEETGSRTHLAWVAYDYGRFMLARGDQARGRELLQGARQLARELAMPELSVALDRALASAAPAEPAAPPASVPAVPLVSGFRLRSEGEVWLVECGGSAFRLKDSKGLRMLAQLIDEPGRELHVLELIEPGGGSDTGDAGEVLDQRARNAYRARIDSLRAELAEAEANADLGRAEQSRQELELLGRELARAVGLGGRDRKSAAAAERARVNVQRRLRDAIRRIGEHNAELAKHLDWAVHTGTFCSYDPR